MSVDRNTQRLPDCHTRTSNGTRPSWDLHLPHMPPGAAASGPAADGGDQGVSVRCLCNLVSQEDLVGLMRSALS